MAPAFPAQLSEQQAPIAGRQREARARIRPVSQALLRLAADDRQDLFTATIDKVLKWLANRAGSSLPESAWQRKSFELDAIGAQRPAAVSLERPRFWATRLDDADKQRGHARERTRCFRLYYFWDDDTQCAVVGWLPSHLDNSLT
ncbi:MAG: hypothetical protein Fur0019_13850 [Tibeticola sp.]